MITAQFLAEWAIRSSILIGSGALLLRLLRVKDPSIRLAACTAVVCGSLAIPLLTTAFPRLPVSVLPAAASTLDPPVASHVAAPTDEVPQHNPALPRRIDWGTAAVVTYALISAMLLLRLGTGLLLARNLRLTSRATGLETDGIEVRESDRITSPVTLGIARSAIVLPIDWPEWDRAKLDAVLAHEKSHVRRKDPVVQLLSSIHRALLWHSPLSWALHQRIVRLAEEASDDAAVAVTRDRASYAGMLLDFMQRGVRGVNWHGVAMARYGRPDDRIHRILDSAILSTGVTRKAVAAIFTLAVPLAYVTAAAIPSRAGQSRPPAPAANPIAVSTPANTRRPAAPWLIAAAQAPTAPSTKSGQRDTATIRRYMIFLGDTRSGSWDSRDPVDEDALRAKFGQRFAWFRHGGAEHVITDAGVLRDIEQAMEPQTKVNALQNQVNQLQSTVNRMQSKVNSQQNDVNALQQKVNAHQDDVNAAQQQVNKRQDLLNRIQNSASREDKEAVIQKLEKLLSELRTAPGGATQEEVNRLQAQVNQEQGRVNEEQHKVNQEQDRVNAEQHKVNMEQGKVNEVQRRVSAEYSERIQEIFDSALRRGLARRLN